MFLHRKSFSHFTNRIISVLLVISSFNKTLNFNLTLSLCRNLYSFVVYLYVNGSGSITSVGEERANLSAVVYL